MKTVAILVLFLAALAMYFKSKAPGKNSKNTQNRRRIAKPDSMQSATAHEGGTGYSGVTIKLCANACGAAKELPSTRYLSGEAPLLPLSDCNKSDCACKYAHFSDRRDIHEDRLHDYSMQTDLYDTNVNQNRRQNKERRVQFC
jgi:hypothetical protein